MTASRFRHIAYAPLTLLGGCVWQHKYERVDVTLERIALRDAWLQTFVPFALALCLMLLLVVLYYRRNAPDTLDVLFKPRHAPDLVGAVRTWWRNREELAPFQGLFRLQQDRARFAERTAKSEAERAARREVERAEREALRMEEDARRALPPLGPPTLGFFSRVAIGFLTGLVLTTLVVLPFTTNDASGFAGYFILFGGGAGIIISFIASLVCATLVSALEKKATWIATLCGASGALLGFSVVPAIWFLGNPIVMLLGGSAIGFAVGVADEMSRKPESVVRSP